MNRLHHELQRLYGEGPGHARLAVLTLARPADWTALGAVWRAVQADLGLPAPAIAVSGLDGFELWFALADTAMAPMAADFLPALCRRYLGDLPQAAARLHCWSAAQTTPEGRPTAPPQLRAPGQWSAFVAPDLAPVFSEEPWLDTEPGPDAQADVLARLQCISAAQLRAAMASLGLGSEAPADAGSGVHAPQVLPSPRPLHSEAAAFETDPHAFLLRLMNDAQQPMALRLEAAKALLPFGRGLPQAKK